MLGGVTSIGSDPALAPNAQDTRMHKVDAASAIERIQAFQHIVRIAGVLAAFGDRPVGVTILDR